MSAGELIDLYASWCDKYPIRSIEDGLEEDDWEGWRVVYEEMVKMAV